MGRVEQKMQQWVSEVIWNKNGAGEQRRVDQGLMEKRSDERYSEPITNESILVRY